MRKNASEGYIYASYGESRYLKHAVASVSTLRRYDNRRPVALICDKNHRKLLEKTGLTWVFDEIIELNEGHASIVGYKHNLHHYMPFKKNLFIDSDIIWCKNPDDLWVSLSIFDFTITGIQVSDSFFGGPKNWRVINDIFLKRRQSTLDQFGLTYLSRVQTGMIYASEPDLTRRICEMASTMLEQQEETHFRSRLKEAGRNEESCEWSLAMAMARLKIPVYPWMQGVNSPQLDFIESYTSYDKDFYRVTCTYYCDPLVYSFRGLKQRWFRSLLTRLFSMIPGKGDYLYVTPYCLHFGWYHQKDPFYSFSERNWKELLSKDQSVVAV